MQENTPTPTEEEDTWSLSKIPVAGLGNIVAALVFCGLMAYVIRDGQREKPPVAEHQRPSVSVISGEEQIQVLGIVTTQDTRIDINTASRSQVESLPGIGEGIAREIIARRPFATVESLNDVPGIGPKRLAKLIPLIKVGTGQPSIGEGTQ